MFSQIILNVVSRWFPYIDMKVVEKEVEERHNQAAGDSAARYTRGNTSIQRGAFQMEDELPRPLDRRKHRI